MPRPRFVELKHNNRVVPENGEAFIIQSGRKLRVIAETPETITVQTLNRQTIFFVSPDEVKPTEMLKTNEVYFDREMKEHVLVTNGECVLSHHEGTEKFHEEHEGGQCLYAPSEAIAIRCIGTEVMQSSDSLVPVCAWTYRAVNPNDLVETKVTVEQFRKWMEASRGRI